MTEDRKRKSEYGDQNRLCLRVKDRNESNSAPMAEWRKGAILQRVDDCGVFKGLGVAKRYCRRDSIGDRFSQG